MQTHTKTQAHTGAHPQGHSGDTAAVVTHTPLALTLKSIALLLSYPEHEGKVRTVLLGQVSSILLQQAPFTRTRKAEVEALIASLLAAGPLQLEAEYVQTFDTRRNQSLHLFEHVHGDSRDRGPAMIDLTQTYIQHGLYLHEGELPDYLPVVLEFAATLDDAQAKSFLAEFAHLLKALYSALTGQRSRYACLFAALLELAGEKVELSAVQANEPIDLSWEEPLAFDACSTKGQQAPADTHVIQIVRPAKTQGALT
jgi:nitrate reductase delta subunit